MSALVELQTRLESMAQEVEALREGLRRAFALTDSDPEMSLLRTRMVLENIIHDVYRRYLGEPGTQPQEALLQKLVKQNRFPRTLEGYADAVRKLGNMSAHPSTTIRYTTDDVRRALENLLPIIEWYVTAGSKMPESGTKERLDGAGRDTLDAESDAASTGSAPVKSASETGFFAMAIDAAADSGATHIADRLCTGIQEIVTAHNDREEAVRFIRLHLQGEMEDTEEWLASTKQGAEELKTKPKKTTGEIASFAFQNIFYARETADAKKKKRTLQMMLGELDSPTSGRMNPGEIAEKLSQVARFYLK